MPEISIKQANSDFYKNLTALQRDINNRLRRVLRAESAIVRDDMRPIMPDDTGILKASVGTKVSIKKQAVYAVIGPRNSYRGKGGEAPARYVAPIEFGRHQYHPIMARHMVQNLGERKGTQYLTDLNERLRSEFPEGK